MNVVHTIKAQAVAGAENHLSMLLPALVGLGHQITLITLTDRGLGEMSPDYRGLLAGLERLGVRVEEERVKHRFDGSVVPRLARRLRALAPEIVHTHSPFADLFAAMAARRAG